MMESHRVLCVLAWLGLAMLTSCATVAHPERAYVVLLTTANGHGSGVVIAPRRILTAAHVPDEGLRVTVGGHSVNATVLRKSATADLALLDADVDCPCAPLGNVPSLDDAVTVVGYPLGPIVDNAQSLTDGRYQGIVRHYELLSAPIAPGSSGGGVFLRGRLVGIVSGLAVVPFQFFQLPVWHISLAVPITEIREFLHQT